MTVPPPPTDRLNEQSGPPEESPPPRSVPRMEPPSYEALDMAPPAAPPEAPASDLAQLPGSAVNDEAWFNHLRLLRTEVQDLRSVLDSIRRGESSLQRYAEYIKLSCLQIDDLVAALEGDDTIRRIQNTWEKMKTCPLLQDPSGVSDTQTQIQHLIMLDSQCRELVYWTAYKTIPQRLKQWLAATQPGYAIPFHAVFEDEVPDLEDRQKILNALAWSPNVIGGGIIDPITGLIYRYSESFDKRLRSLGIALGALAVATLLIFLAGMLPPLNGAATSWLMLGWAALLTGTLIHIGVGVSKRMRGQGAIPVVLPTGRFLLLVDAKLGEILFKIVMALVGFLGFVYATGFSERSQFGSFLLNAFLVGYSLDSFVEIFGATIDQRTAALQSNLSKRLEIRSGS